jgi:hypothetical protein
MSRVDDGSKPSLDGLIDRGVQSHGVTRASHLRPGQKLRYSNDWASIRSVQIVDGKVKAKGGGITWTFAKSEIVEVRDILHTYTESDTP